MVTMTRAFLPLLSLGLSTLSACSGAADSASDWDGLAWDSAGVEIVHNYGTPLWKEAAQRPLSEVLRIGVADGEPEYMFGKISDLGMLSDGRLVVVDGVAQHLRYFHPDGRWERTVGQAGSGPGEFGNVGLGVLVGPGDTVLVMDIQNRRANRIAPDGTWLGSWPVYLLEDGWMDMVWDYSPTGRIVSQMSRYAGVPADESEPMDYILLRDLAGVEVDTVGRVPASLRDQVSEGRTETHFFAGEPEFSLCPDNSLLTGRQDRYEISRYDSFGDLEQLVRLDRETIPVSESDQNTLRQWYKETWLESGYFSLARVEDLLSSFRFNETYPPFRTLTCGPQGSIWIQPWKPLSDLSQEDFPDIFFPQGIAVDAAEHFDVFDREGKYLGIVSLPEGFFPNRFRGDHLIGRWRDSLDVEYVGVLKVEGILSGTEG